MKIFNTLTKQKEEFIPLHKDSIGMYICGVTVYGPLHMGHARTYIAFDMIKNYLTHFKGKHVYVVQNITDVGHIVGDVDDGEDKIQRRANQEKKHPLEIVDENIRNMWGGMDSLKCDRPNIAPRATGHIVEIIDAVQELTHKGFAYEVNGNVYFNVSKFKEYGKLSGNTITELEAGARIQINEEKKHPFDFALWKKADVNHIMQWSSPWGKGYPGWHIECSVMSTKYLGKTFDIHGGAKELSFPHHENEIAQSESLTGQKFVNYWMHTGILSINGQKMAKSLGNFVTVTDALTNYTPETVRFFVLSQHYASPVDYAEDLVKSSHTALDRINQFFFSLQTTPKSLEYNSTLNSKLQEFVTEFEGSMDDDFNTPVALSKIYGFINYANKQLAENNLNKKNAEEITSYFSKINAVFKCFSLNPQNGAKSDVNIDALLAERAKAKQEKDWARADSIREQLNKMNIELYDRKDGTTTYRQK